MDSRRLLNASVHVGEPSPRGIAADGEDCLNGSGRTRAAVPKVPVGEVNDARLRAHASLFPSRHGRLEEMNKRGFGVLKRSFVSEQPHGKTGRKG
ncbi:hypothetical protein CJF30_00007105 [Rutstroemia sp. NJR-2017a BBW]|nr:hypothetical protein CJF30_00007105 [Rutstroemia sp. NJR-2017a BBW]